MSSFPRLLFFFFNDTATTEIYTLSLHDALPIYLGVAPADGRVLRQDRDTALALQRVRVEHPLAHLRSEEHTSELQSQSNLVCRLLLEKKKKNTKMHRGLHSISISDVTLKPSAAA